MPRDGSLTIGGTSGHDPGLAMLQEYLDHNEPGLAFDCRVDLGDERDLPVPFCQNLDQGARE